MVFYVIANLPKASVAISEFNWDCFVAKAPRNDENSRYDSRDTRYELGLTEKGNSYTIKLVFSCWFIVINY